MMTWLCSTWATKARMPVAPLLLAPLLLASVLAGCVTGFAPDRLNMLDPSEDFARAWRAYPDMDARYARAGTRDQIASVRQVALGQDIKAVEAAIGKPVMTNPDAGYSEFNISLQQAGRDRMICQYRVYFDAAGKVTASVWRRPQCANLVVHGSAAGASATASGKAG